MRAAATLLLLSAAAVAAALHTASVSPAGADPLPGACGGGARPAGASFGTRSPVLSSRGMVASAHPLASQAGLDALKAGGSAVDAALATNLVLAVLEPMMNGPGGDLMAIVRSPNGTLNGYNGAGRAAANFSLNGMRAALAAIGAGTDIPTAGPLSVTVPGAPRAWCDLHARFGVLPWASLFAAAIDYATNGAPTPQIIAEEWDVIPDSPALSSGGRFPHARDGWVGTFGSPVPVEGARFANAALAGALASLRDGGCAAFYEEGPIPDALEALAGTAGIKFTRADLRAHVGEWVTPINTTYRGRYVLSQLPPNPQGAAALLAMNILEAFNFSAADFNTADYIHAHVEAKKLAFADASAYFADPDFVDVPVDAIISKAYAAQRRALINMTSAAQTDAPGKPKLENVYGGDTTYLTAADSSGMMVSWIQSLYTGFGSGVVAPSLGFALQSRGALFSTHDGAANVYAPGKRPFHTIMPGFASSDDMELSYGVMGGFMQPQGHVQVLANMIDAGMNVQEAGDAARYYHSGSSTPMGDVMTDGGSLQLEPGVCDAVVADLEVRGHRITRGANTGGYQAIKRARDADGNVYYAGATEFRKDGIVAAY